MGQIVMQPVKSSNASRAGYDDGSKTLRVQFLSGTYDYHNVPRPTYDALMKAESFGKFLGAHVKPHFKFTKLAKEEA